MNKRLHYIHFFLFIITFLFSKPILTHAQTFQESNFLGKMEKKAGAALAKREISSWNKENKNKMKVSNGSLGCHGGYEYKESRYNYITHSDCRISITFSNNTDEYINYIVVDISILNETTKKLVTQSKVTLEVSVVPTVTLDLKAFFNNSLFQVAQDQLGDNFAWNYEFIGGVPKVMNSEYLDDYNWLD